MSDSLVNSTAEIFKALGDQSRLKILRLISKNGNNLCVGMIAGKLDISQPAVSQHLKILKNSGLVMADRKGYHIHYSVNSQALEKYGIDTLQFLKGIDAEINSGSECELRDKKEECESLNSKSGKE
jgi:ArsR family transcriptional regulator, arsenate/arsenite/antimonite-responsive transcriptional repressor